MTRNRRNMLAFTLLELVLVLLVLSLMVALAAPSLRGWRHGARLRDAADELLSATRWAQSQAVSTAAVQRLEVNSAAGAYRVTSLSADGTQAEPAVDGPFGRAVSLPDDIRIDVARADRNTSGVIEFYPSGRVTPARLRLTAQWGEWIDIESAYAAEPFRQIAQVTP